MVENKYLKIYENKFEIFQNKFKSLKLENIKI
jgi:hypothetical protein